MPLPTKCTVANTIPPRAQRDVPDVDDPGQVICLQFVDQMVEAPFVEARIGKVAEDGERERAGWVARRHLDRTARGDQHPDRDGRANGTAAARVCWMRAQWLLGTK